MTSISSSPLVFVPLSSGVRRGLESSVVGARGVVEVGVGRVFDRLGIKRDRDPFSSGVPVGLSDGERVLRRVVGVKVRQAGGFDAAVEDVAFSVWHRMLFARFLAENGLLMHPVHDVAVSLDECGELADEGLGADRWVVASQFAARMLPGLFPTDDPLGRIELLPEDLRALEEVLDGIPSEVFSSDDGLGWVYQFWQSRAKDVVNASEVKIGARELPAVTQLFTEHYMVRFLLENSLGAWWAAKHPDSPLIEAFEYLRFHDEGDPAAGSFEGWPDRVAEVSAMDLACGSGHFLTSLFEMLWRMRVEEEGLEPVAAQDLVLAENLFGLELDARCTQIAAFNVALAAWKAGGYRQLPELNVACSGIRVAGSRDSWLELAGGDPRLRDGLERLHDVFKDADTLGSLIDPRRAVGDDSLLAAGWDEIQPLLTTALERETTEDPAAAVFGQQVAGVAKAADLLSRRYTLIATNPPFLARRKQSAGLVGHADRRYAESRADLALMMLVRSLDLVGSDQTTALVIPQRWRYQTTYRALRSRIMDDHSLIVIAALGTQAFSTPMWDFGVDLMIISGSLPRAGHRVTGLDVSASGSLEAKAESLRSVGTERVVQQDQRSNPDARLTMKALPPGRPLGEYVRAYQGIATGDDGRFRREFWEFRLLPADWDYLQSTVTSPVLVGGCHSVVAMSEISKPEYSGSRVQGAAAWTRRGVSVSAMGSLPVALYLGTPFDMNAAALVPMDPGDVAPLWLFARSDGFAQAARILDTTLKVTNATFERIPFDIERWRRLAAVEFPDGLPEPWSDDPTQWLFLGRPEESTDPLQAGVARLLGYSWPDQEPDDLDRFADADGIVCLPAVAGELPAADRLRELLVEAFDAHDDPVGLIDGLLADADASGKSLGWWLENRFFKQHHQLFHKRPFIWHITDHHKGGFSALVNYHKLDRAGLERLAFTYLGWWIDKQRAGVTAGVAGADDRLAAAETLQEKLKLILGGEPPFDIFVRWKSLAEQPIGWEPDLDDGVRLNIRPFVEADVLIIRKKIDKKTGLPEIPGIKWGKDRGKNPDGSERYNDLHYTRAEKQAARNNQ